MVQAIITFITCSLLKKHLYKINKTNLNNVIFPHKEINKSPLGYIANGLLN